MRLSRWLVAGLVLGGASVAATADNARSDGKTLYKWTDDKGVVHYSDRVPPEAAPREHDQLDPRGSVRRVIPREKTAEETAEEERKVKQRQQQAALDRSLLQSYQGLTDLQNARDERLRLLDERLQQSQKVCDDSAATLADLRAREEAMQDEDPDARSNLGKQIQTYETSHRQAIEATAKLKAERESIASQYAHDIARYQELRPPPSPAELPKPN